MRTQSTTILAVSAALLVGFGGVAHGQIASLQAGVTPLEYESEFEVGARFSPHGHAGLEFSIDIYPKYIMTGTLVGVADASFAANVQLGPVAIEPRVGGSLLGVVGTGGVVDADGWSGGVGIVLTIDSRTVLRADYTYRRLVVGEGDEAYPFPSLTAGFVIHH
ncbi:MAG TPA: hypothetical protein VFP39_07440 [Gemmatimonadales bacterium]|nr:hypothetical protein [Gemmatimonadales bacterium]